MKSKIVVWGHNAADEKILVAIELLEKENTVKIHSFVEQVVSEEFYNSLRNDWKNGKDVEFVAEHKTIERTLSVTEDLLPEDIKVERTDLINRAKAEWHFIVLSSKLYELYSSELSDIKDKVEQVEEFSSSIWEEMKGFWNKVQEQVREKNLFREHANDLRQTTNSLFDQLKVKRKAMDAKFREESKKQYSSFMEQLNDLSERVESGKSLNPIFDELKRIQSNFSKIKFAQDDRSKIWSKLDGLFKVVKEKKYGNQGGGQASNNALERLGNRYQGLLKAIERMENSINRDKKDKNNQNYHADRAPGQLEAQLRQAKIMMIDERIQSKETKLKDMYATKAELEKRMEKEKVRQQKQAEKAELEAKKAEKKQEIIQKIAENQPSVNPEEAEKLEAAALAIKAGKKQAKSNSTEANSSNSKTTEEKGGEIEDLVEDVVEKVEETVDHVLDQAKTLASAALVTLDNIVDKITGEEE